MDVGTYKLFGFDAMWEYFCRLDKNTNIIPRFLIYQYGDCLSTPFYLNQRIPSVLIAAPLSTLRWQKNFSSMQPVLKVKDLIDQPRKQ